MIKSGLTGDLGTLKKKNNKSSLSPSSVQGVAKINSQKVNSKKIVGAKSNEYRRNIPNVTTGFDPDQVSIKLKTIN